MNTAHLTFLTFLALAMVALLAGCAAASTAATRAPLAVLDGEDLVIATADISTVATFYPVEIDGTDLEIIAVKASDGSIRTAFNTCQVCFDSGRGYYVQEGDTLVCQNCGNRFRMDQVEVVAGGCNPVPIFAESKEVSADSITIPYDYLDESREIFNNWKS
jgi:uncharacterized membrane protein